MNLLKTILIKLLITVLTITCMVAQVLADLEEMKSLNDFDLRVLKKMKYYTKPIKTRHLASRLKTDCPTIAESLNKLAALNLVSYKIPKRSDDKPFCGWLLSHRSFSVKKFAKQTEIPESTLLANIERLLKMDNLSNCIVK